MTSRIAIILQKGLGNHQILCTAKSRSTNKEGIKQLLDDIEEELHPLEIYTANYFRMGGGQDLEDLLIPVNHSFNDQLPSTCGLDIFRKDFNQWKKENKGLLEDEYEDNNYMEEEDIYLETSDSNEDDTTSETFITASDEVMKADIEEINDVLTVIEKQSTQKMTKEQIKDEVKIYEEAAIFRRRLQEIKVKQSSVKSVEQMAKITLNRVAKIRALARHKLRRLDKARSVYLRKLKALLKKIKKTNYY